MGCCAEINKNINPNKDIMIDSEEGKKNNKNIKESNSDYQNIQKTEKEETKKEKSTLDNKNSQKTEKIETKQNSSKKPCTSSKSNELFNNINKNKLIKKGSHRVQLAMKELKMLSIEEINSNNKKFFN